MDVFVAMGDFAEGAGGEGVADGEEEDDAGGDVERVLGGAGFYGFEHAAGGWLVCFLRLREGGVLGGAIGEFWEGGWGICATGGVGGCERCGEQGDDEQAEEFHKAVVKSL